MRVVYVSPLKALAVDVERNLRAPLAGIGRTAARDGVALRAGRVHVRTGDTPARDRQRQQRDPAEILVTTPESLYLLLTSGARDTLRTVHTVIIDEIHTLVPTKRGVHLALSLERLAALCDADPQRIGLSATVRPPEVAATYLGGDRPVRVVDTSEPPRLALTVRVTVDDMEAPPPAPEPLLDELDDDGDDLDDLDGLGDLPRPRRFAQGPSGTLSSGLWPSITPELLSLIRAHRSTILFVNSRILCERLAGALNELAGEPLVRAHHGSLSHARRAEVEEALKAGTVPAIVATSSLELGIDMGAVDLVILVESPGSVASALQRVGRAGHQVGAVSEGVIVPKYRGDLLECAVVAQRMHAGALETLHAPARCLDVLAQQIVAIVAEGDIDVDALGAMVRRAAPYRDLSPELLGATLDMLSGRYPSDAFADLTPRLTWDRTAGTLSPRRGAQRVAILNGGTIPDRGLYRVHLAPEGPRLGELDEEMVYETREGDVIVLGASAWRVEEITRDVVYVSPAPGQAGRLPFWRGERPGRPLALGRAVGAFLRTLSTQDDRDAWLAAEVPSLDARARANLLRFVAEQEAATGTLPTDRAVTVERFRDELGDWRICVLTPFGARVHAPWSLAIEAHVTARTGFDVQVFHSDDGISLRLVDGDDLPPIDALFPDPDDVEELVVQRLRDAPLFAARFREAAGRALLLPRRGGQGRKPLWLQRKKAADLLAVAQQHPSFPIVLETYRECLQDVFDLDAVREVLGGVRDRSVRVDEVEAARPSPFARGLAFQFVAAFLYDGDAPVAERRAQALALDRDLLRELLGQEGLRDVLDAGAIDDVEATLQRLAPETRARHPDALHDLLRRLGDLTPAEVDARVDGPSETWLAALEAARRVVAVRVAGEVRWIAVEDAGRYRDALGVALPPGLPQDLLDPVPDPLHGIVRRWARTHGPFHARDVAVRFGLGEGLVRTHLDRLAAHGTLVHAALRPGGQGLEWCDDDVLRRIRRRSLAALRAEIEPVPPAVFGAFLPSWQGVGDARAHGIQALRDALIRLEGCALPFSALEREILPARVPGYTPMLLDQLGAMGEIVWVGRGALGPADGRITLVRRDQLAPSPPPPDAAPLSPLAQRLEAHLRARGACFLTELHRVGDGAPVAEVQTALWDLVWAGRVTNDTFAPLRSLSQPSRRGRAPVAGGRWSILDDAGPVDPTARRLAEVESLLERYGLVTRDIVRAEEIPGGFSALYPVLRELEARGAVRRGHFLDGLGGAQFALPGAVDRLRAAQHSPSVRVLPAVDPSNPWGAALPWPAPPVPGGRPQRVAGARVVLVDGAPALWLGKGGRAMVAFVGDGDDTLGRAVAALRDTVDHRALRVERLDGAAITTHPLRRALERLGFTRDPKGLALSRGP